MALYEKVGKTPTGGDHWKAVEKAGYGEGGQKWSGSQVWAAAKQAGVPPGERQAIVESYAKTGQLPSEVQAVISSWLAAPSPPMSGR